MAFNLSDADIQTYIDGIGILSHADELGLSRTLFKEYFEQSPISELHDIQSGVKCNTPIPFMDTGSDYTFMQDGADRASGCDDIECDINVVTSVKQWSPVPYTCAVPFCFKDVSCLMKDFFGSEKCSDADPRGTQYARFTEQLMGDRILKSHWTKAWFANTGSTHTALKGHDGLWVQILTAVTPTSDNYVNIPENAGLTYVDQSLGGAPQRAYEVFNEMNEKAENHPVLRRRPNTPILSTRALAYNYLQWLRATKQVDCCERDPMTGVYQLDRLTIYGRPIRVVDEWDEIMRDTGFGTEFDDGTRVDMPHRAVLTYKENMPLGTCDSGELSSLETRYDAYNNKSKIVAEYTIDAKLLWDDHVIAAY